MGEYLIDSNDLSLEVLKDLQERWAGEDSFRLKWLGEDILKREAIIQKETNG